MELAPAEAVALASLAEPPMDLLTEALDLCRVTRLPQRLAHLEHQPEHINDIFPRCTIITIASLTTLPRHKHLMIKRSQRCRRCEHNLSKPEYNPTSIKVTSPNVTPPILSSPDLT